MLNNAEKGAGAARRFGSLALLVMNVYAGATLVVMGLALLGYFVVAALVDDAVRQHGAESHRLLSQQLQQQLEEYVRPVEVLAADPRLQELMAVYPEEIVLREQELAAVLGAQGVVLILAGQEKGLLGEFPALSYAELDLIHAVQRGELPPIEFHDLGQGPAHIDVLRPVVRHDALAGSITVGYLLARFDSAMFVKRLQGVFDPADRVELSQVLSDGSTQLFMGWGDTALKGAGEAFSGPVAGSSWRLSLWLPHKEWRIQGMSWWLFYWVLSGGVLVVLALALLVLWRLTARKTVASANKIHEYVWDRINGHWMGKSYVTALSEMQPLLEKLQNLNWSAGEMVKGGGLPQQLEAAAPAVSGVAASQQELSFVDLLYQDSRALEVVEAVAEPELAKREGRVELSPSIFRAYDIRGIVGKTLMPEVVYDIGRAFGCEAKEAGGQTVVVARDGRASSMALSSALIQGLCDAGRDVIDIGQVPTPVLYFATHYLSARSGIMVTGSHNPPEYNGLKMVMQGETLSGETIQKLYLRITNGDCAKAVSRGNVSQQSLTADYMARIAGDVHLLRELKVVLDCGNGVAGDVAPQLLRVLGCDVVELHCEVDGRFPNHHPDPSQPENLSDLIAAVRKEGADIGIAFDGDGDRLGVIDSSGNIIWPDRQMMLFAMDMLKEQPGGMVIYDVKCSRNLRRVIEEYGGKPLMWKTGHSLLKAKLRETGALMAGELSGHLFFNDRWYGFDDGLYAMARLLEIVSREKGPSAALFKRLPDAIGTPEMRVALPEGAPARLMERLKAQANFPGAQIITIDGIRAEFEDGWGLVRASNTMPSLTFRFEAVSVEALKRIQGVFRDTVQALEPGLELPFD